MKIAYITTYFPFGLAEAFFEPEVRSLSREIDVIVVPTRPIGRAVSYPNLGAQAHYLAIGDGRTMRLALGELVRDPRGVARAFGIVFGPSYAVRSKAVNAAVFASGLALAADLRRMGGVDHIHANWLTTPGTMALIAAELTGIPLSFTAHQHDIFYDNLTRQKVAASAFTRVISARNCQALQRIVGPQAALRCTVVHLGVEIPPSITIPPARERLRIICAARMCTWKGHRFLLRALALLKARGVAFTCDLAGGGEIRDEVDALIDALELRDVVTMLGNVPHSKLLARLHAGDYDVFALASTEREGEHEGISVALMESMAAGIPVVSTQTGSLNELVEPDNGYLVPQQDPEAIAAALTELAGDRELRLRLGARARQKVQAQFETSVTTAELLRLLRGESTPPFAPVPAASAANDPTDTKPQSIATLSDRATNAGD
jgi:glycosyltransferase involved in cell wall biosynthesis